LTSLLERIRRSIFNSAAKYMKVSADNKPEVVQHTGGNFKTYSISAFGSRSEAQAAITRWTYTVPTGKIAKVKLLYSIAVCEVASTTTTTTDAAAAWISHQPAGASEYTIFMALLNAAAMSPNDRTALGVGEAGLMEAGDAMRGRDEYTGAAAGAGRAFLGTAAIFEEYDA